MNLKWERVNKKAPCVICGKFDWCCASDKYFLCMRVESPKPCKSGGWLHLIDAKPKKFPGRAKPAAPPVSAPDFEGIHMKRLAVTPQVWLEELAARMGVSALSLEQLGFGYAYSGGDWIVPFRDGNNNIIGLQVRKENGEKMCLTGSKLGLFLPCMDPQPCCWITEGASDCAAAITLGLYSIGRPSCMGGVEHLKVAVKRLRIRQAVIVADNDSPGVKGAGTLAKQIGIPCCIYLPPCKDLREFLKLGGTREILESAIKHLIWNQPK